MGLKENIAAGLICLIGPISLALLYFEKHSELVRFYIVQNLLLYLATALLTPITCGLFAIVYLVFLIIEIVKAFKGEKYKMPLLGNWAEKILS